MDHRPGTGSAGQVRVQTWAESGVTQQPGWEHTAGLTLTSPAGGTIDVRWVHGRAGGDRRDEPENIIEGEPPAPVEPVALTRRRTGGSPPSRSRRGSLR